MYLTVHEVAIRECVPMSTVLDWVDQGLELHDGPSGEELISAEELAEFLGSLRVESEDSDDASDADSEDEDVECDCGEEDCDCDEEEE